MINKNIEVIYFDAGGVLFETKNRHKDRMTNILLSLGYDINAINNGIKNADDDTKKQIESGKLIGNWQEEKKYWEKYYQTVVESIEEKDSSLVDQLFYSTHYGVHCALFKETIEVLETLQKHYRLAVISNALPSMDWVFDHLNIRQYFEAIVISAFEGVHKPDPNIYKNALKKMSVTPEKCLFVDDKIENVRAADALGMQGLHLQRGETHTFNNLTGLLKHL